MVRVVKKKRKIMEENTKYDIFTEPRGQYVIIQEKRLFQISFPSDATLEENLRVVKEMGRALEAAIEKQRKEKENLEKD